MRLSQLISSLLIAGVWCYVATASGLMAQESADDPEKADYLPQMRSRADQVVVASRENGDSHRQPLQITPLFRYSDPRRFIRDAALWGYGEQGRPAALMKTEFYEDHWVYCITSLSDALIEAKWNDGIRFDSREPGLTLRPIPNGPRPGANPGTRLVQLKGLTKRFSATIQNGLDNLDQMRLMPTPICRYNNAQAGLIDGALFGYTMGTNPDVLLAIELHRSENGTSEWRCGAAGMTSAGFVVRMDETEILKQEFDPSKSGRPQAYARWMWRRGSLADETRDSQSK